MSGSFVATAVIPVTLSAFNISTKNNKPLYPGQLKQKLMLIIFQSAEALMVLILRKLVK